MGFVESACILIHIRVSHLKFAKVCVRHIVTVALIIFMAGNLVQLLIASEAVNFAWADFIEASIFIIATVYLTLMWIVSWPKANKMLNKAGDYEKKYKEKDKCEI